MTSEEFSEITSRDLERILSENSVNILEKIIERCDEQQLNKDTINVARNAVTASVQLSVQIMFSYLDSLGMLNLENLVEHHERPQLHLIKGGLEPR